MRSLMLVLLGFLMMAFLSPFLNDVSAGGYTPALALMMSFYIGLTMELEHAVFVALILGALQDGFATGQAIGMNMELAVLTALVASRMSQRLVLRGLMSVMVLGFLVSLVGSIVEIVLSLIFVQLFHDGQSGVGLILRNMFPQALLSAPFGVIVFWLFDKLDSWVSQKGDSVFL